MYLRDLSQMDVIFTNSKNTQARLKHFTGKDSNIIFPPVDISYFRPSEIRKDYYLSYARLSSIKRVDRIVDAFKEMPDKELVFTY
jgi:glycosyltransferase involved in cell wall biosynthesis